MPSSAHAAFIKACSYFNIELRRVAVNLKTFKCNMKDIKNKVDKNTIMVI